LGRRELVVEDHEIRLGAFHTFPKLVDLTLSDVGTWMWSVDPLTHDVDDLTTCGVGQPGQLLEMFLGNTLIESLQGSTHEHHPLHNRAVVDQLGRNVGLLGIRRGIDKKTALRGQTLEVGPVVQLGTVEDFFQQVSKYFAELRPRGKPQLLEVGTVQREVCDRKRRALVKNRPECLDPTDHVVG
jgi:hypothetical protein